MMDNVSNKVKKYFQIAANEALKSPMSLKHGALVVGKGGTILAKGHNHYQTRILGSNFCSTHAEVCALKTLHSSQSSPFRRNAQMYKYVNKEFVSTINGRHKHSRCKKEHYDLYVVRYNGGMFRDSKPCHQCEQWLIQYNIYRVIYTTGDNDFYKIMKVRDLVK